MKDVLRMTRPQCERMILDLTGEEPLTGLTMVELRDQLRDVLKANSDPAAAAMKGATGLKKEALIARCREVGLTTVTEEWTKPKILYALREHLRTQGGAKPTDKLMFGMYKNKSYSEVWCCHEDYVTFCEGEVSKSEQGIGKSSSTMIRFVKWFRSAPLSEKEQFKSTVARSSVGSPSPGSRGSASASTRSTSRRRTRSPTTGDEELVPDKDDGDRATMVKALASMMAKMDDMAAKLKELEATKKKDTDGSSSEASGWVKPALTPDGSPAANPK